MRLLMLVLLVALAIVPTETKEQRRTRPALSGWVVVLDPGHGGVDPGSSGTFNGKRVVEDEYVFDVALRTRRIIRSMGGLSFLTIEDKVGERSLPAQSVFPDVRSETYTGTSVVVRAGSDGLNRRLAYGNSVSRKYPRHKQAWISIHFDVLGRNRVIEGVRIIKARGSNKLADALGASFAKYNRLRDFAPVVQSGDPQYGLRNLFILNGNNRIREKVLVELGNFNNTTDVWRVRNPVTREAYARAIAEALRGW